MHAPQGPATGTSQPDPDGRRSLPRLTLRGRRNGGGGPESPGTASSTGPRRPAAALVDTPDPADESDDDVDWRAIGVFGAGLALGVVLGAASALLLAPATGFETRTRIALGARRAGERAADRWDDLGERVRYGARRSRRNLERKIIRARWRAQDAWERKRYAEE